MFGIYRQFIIVLHRIFHDILDFSALRTKGRGSTFLALKDRSLRINIFVPPCRNISRQHQHHVLSVLPSCTLYQISIYIIAPETHFFLSVDHLLSRVVWFQQERAQRHQHQTLAAIRSSSLLKIKTKTEPRTLSGCDSESRGVFVIVVG